MNIKLINFITNIKTLINKSEIGFNKRHNSGIYTNKLDFKNTLFASSNVLNKSGIDNVISTLDLDNIVNVSKNSLIKKRNCEYTHLTIKKLNNDILNHFYEPLNNFVNSYNFKIDFDRRSFSDSLNFDPKDKKLYINYCNKRFIANDGSN